MREEADRQRIRRVMEAFGRAAAGQVRVYLVGGTTAVLLGWRATTIDVDFVMRPDDEGILRAIPPLKETLRVNLDSGGNPGQLCTSVDEYVMHDTAGARTGWVLHLNLCAERTHVFHCRLPGPAKWYRNVAAIIAGR